MFSDPNTISEICDFEGYISRLIFIYNKNAVNQASLFLNAYNTEHF